MYGRRKYWKTLKVTIWEKTFEIADSMEQLKEIPPYLLTDYSAHYTFGDDTYCVFGNMANAMHFCGDNRAARFSFSNRHKHMPMT